MEHCLLSLSAASTYLGQYAEARRWAEEGLQISKALHHRSGIGEALKWLGLISDELGDAERAESLLQQSVAQFREIGDRTLIADALVDLGVVTRASGPGSKAKNYLLEALRTAIETRTNHTALQALVELASIEMKEGKAELALELVTGCLQQPSTRQALTERAQSLRAELRALLTPQQIEAVEARAHVHTLESLEQEILFEG
jgi:tetratricopeptide (TPR) repeat protein